MNLYTWTLGATHTPAAFVLVASAGLPFDVTDTVASFLFGLAFAPELARMLARIQMRMEADPCLERHEATATEALDSDGFVRIDGPFQTSDAAFDAASAVVEACRLERGLPPVSIVGDFVIPPLDGAASRDFQTLHFDFGLPLDPKVAQDVARYTALYVPADVADVQAATRLVPLVALLGQRSWPPPGGARRSSRRLWANARRLER